MVESSLVRIDNLNRVLALDAEISSANMPAVVEQTVSLWSAVHQSGAVAEIIEWGLIYSLRTTVILDGEHAGKAKWQVTQLNPLFPLAKTWVEFCLTHLDMGPGEASNKKRNWEIFHIELAYNLIDMLIAGIQRLNVARATLAACLKGSPPVFPEKLLFAVFGDPHTCLSCEERVSFSIDVPETCPHCGEVYAHLEPQTVAVVKAIVQELKARPDTKPHVEADLEQSEEKVVVLPYFIDSTGQRYALPAWEVPVLGAGADVGLGGVPEDAISEFMRWVRGRFPEMAG